MKRVAINTDSARLGMSQQELANAIGVSRSQVSMYERGLRSLPTPAMEKLSALTQPIALNQAGRSKIHDEASRARGDLRSALLQKRLKYNQELLSKALSTLESLELRQAKVTARALTAQALSKLAQEKRAAAHIPLTNLMDRANHKLNKGKLLQAIATQEVQIELLTREQQAIKDLLGKAGKV